MSCYVVWLPIMYVISQSLHYMHAPVVIRSAPLICGRLILITNVLGICWLVAKNACVTQLQTGDCLVKTRELLNTLQKLL